MLYKWKKKNYIVKCIVKENINCKYKEHYDKKNKRLSLIINKLFIIGHDCVLKI